MSEQLPGLWADLGTWISFLLSLAIFSLLVRENLLARAAQFLLVGTTLGYTALLVWHNVLRPRLVLPLVVGPERSWALWVAAGLLLLLWIGGLGQFRGLPRVPRLPPWLRKPIGLAALLPVVLLLGVSLGVSLAGSWQGSLLPQFLRAAALGRFSGPNWFADLSGLLTLLITGGVLLFLLVDVDRHLPLPKVPSRLLQFWRGFGQRALWLAGGILFARLVAARVTLLVAWYDQMLTYLEATGLWQWAESMWRSMLR